MANVRQVKLVCGAESQNLQTSPYKLEAGTWASAGTVLEFAVLVTATSLPRLEGYLAALQRQATRAGLYDQQLVGDALYVYTKTCDSLSYTAELGATWTVKRVRAMTLNAADPSELASGQYVLRVGVSCEVEELWRRVAPESVLESTATPTAFTDASLTLPAATLTARRVSWNGSVGLTIRVRFLPGGLADIVFFQTANTAKCWWDNTTGRLKITDDTAVTPKTAQSSVYVASGEMEVVFRFAPATAIKIYVNGVADGSTAGCTLTAVDTYTAIATGDSEVIYSYQLWPNGSNMTDADCTGLYAWGRPELEFPVAVAPADTKNTSSLYKLYNLPGDAGSALRVVLDGAAQDYLGVKAGLRPLRIPTTVAWECESGTLGTDVASAADASASGGNVARFTPSATTYVTRVTLAICANPADVAAMQGEHRLFLACKDSAATVNVNTLKWRLVIAGQAEAYSDVIGAAAISTYSLVDLGTVRIPPGQWPAESISAGTDVVGGTYITLEIAVANAVGAGGGTFDLDALYLVPAELEGTLAGTFDVSAWYELMDFTGERPSFVGVADYRSMEFGAWADYVGDRLELAPRAGVCGALWLGWFRDASEQWYSQDVCDVFLYVEPRWRR